MEGRPSMEGLHVHFTCFYAFLSTYKTFHAHFVEDDFNVKKQQNVHEKTRMYLEMHQKHVK